MGESLVVRRFLLAGFNVQAFIGSSEHPERAGTTSFPGSREDLLEWFGAAQPRPYHLFTSSHGGSLSVVFYDVAKGAYFVRAPSLARAYAISDSVHAFFSLLGEPAHLYDVDQVLLEVRQTPQPDWSAKELLQARRSDEPDVNSLSGIGEGRVVQAVEMACLKSALPDLDSKPHVRTGLVQLSYSAFLFSGHMTGSYYGSHYRHDRSRLTRDQLAQRYFEHRHRYELAFVAAFKALESVLQTNKIEDRQVDDLLTELSDPRAAPSSPYERFHETFRGMSKQSTFGEMVRHFLRLRNVVAAHSNPKAPSKFQLSEDSIFELQVFVRTLCASLMAEWAPARLPSVAFVNPSIIGTWSGGGGARRPRRKP